MAPEKAELTREPRNVPALIGFVLAAIGFVLACIPVVFPLGWIVLLVAFSLSVVSPFLQRQGKGWGIAGLILSILGGLASAALILFLVGGTVLDLLRNPPVLPSPSPESAQVHIITSAGEAIGFDGFAVLEDSLGSGELSTGASLTGSAAYLVPNGEAVTIRVRPGSISDEAFIAP